MDDKDKINALEDVLAQMLKPVKGVPFSVIVKALADTRVIKCDIESVHDAELISNLERAIHICADELKAKPINRPRPNEVGNDVEAYIMRAIEVVGLKASRPTSKNGLGKSTGYPDILISDAYGRPTYLECKIFAHGTPATTMRSFYLSPSDSFKVSLSARHLLLAFGMTNSGSLYTPKSFKLVDLHDLMCDVKYEFNSDNRRLYAPDMVLLQGNL
jgi:hypothetical protein